MDREKTIGYRVRNLSLAIKNVGEKATAALGNENKGKCTHIQTWVIGYLYENRDNIVYQRDVEKQFSVSRPTMTAILQTMEKNGLIDREKEDFDARLKKITLTEKALEIHLKHEKGIEDFENQLREGITDNEMDIFFGIIERITENARLAAERINPVNEK